jgi:two-component system response regulator FlrC
VKSKTAILVAEDEHQTRETIILLLENAGYKVFQTDTVKEALEIIERFRGSEIRICLLILDMEMNGLSGVQVLDSIRFRGDQTPAVVITGLTGAEFLPHLSSLGHVEILARPFDPKRLIDIVSKALAEGVQSK